MFTEDWHRRALTVAAGIALLAATGCNGRTAGTTVTPAAQSSPDLANTSDGTGDDWTTYAHDDQRTGYDRLANPITAENVGTLQMRWSYESSTSFASSPIAVDGSIYVADESGLVSALNDQTGAVEWTYRMANSPNETMTPAYIDGILFVGTQNDDLSNTAYELYALNPSNGSVLWSASLPGALHGSPVAMDGALYVPTTLGDPGYCHANGIYTFNVKTGTPGLSWLTAQSAQPDGGAVWGPVSDDGSNIYFTTGNTCNNTPITANALVSITPELSKRWAINTADPLDDDDVASGITISGSIGYAMGKNGTFYSVGLGGGSIKWDRVLNPTDRQGGFSTPSVANGTVIVGSGYQTSGSMLYAFDSSGSQQWTLASDYPVLAYVARTSTLAFAAVDSNIDVLNPSTGAVIWSYPMVGLSKPGPVITPTGLYVSDLSGRLYAFGLPSQGPVEPSALTRSEVRKIQNLSVGKSLLAPPVFCKSPL